MILHVRWCTEHGPQPTYVIGDVDRVERCPDCDRPLFDLGAHLDWQEGGMGTEAVPRPGEGGVRDGGAPWVDPFNGLLCGVRFVQVVDSDWSVTHWQVYVIDRDYPPGDWRRLHVAAGTICGLLGPRVRPPRLDQGCPTCQQGIGDALAEAKVVLRVLQADGQAP